MIPVKSLYYYLDRLRWSDRYGEELHIDSISVKVCSHYPPKGHPIMIAFGGPPYEEVVYRQELPTAQELQEIITVAVNKIIARNIHGS